MSSPEQPLQPSIDKLEAAAHAMLASADGREETVSYTFKVADGYAMYLESDNRNEDAAGIGTWLEQAQLQTSAFLFQTEPDAQDIIWKDLVFSCVYDHESTIGGWRRVPPVELPPFTAKSSEPKESQAYAATLALARYVDQEILSDAPDYEIDMAEETIFRTFLRSVNSLLADGVVHQRLYIRRAEPLSRDTSPNVPMREIIVESNSFSGSMSHAHPSTARSPILAVHITEDGIDHQYERLQSGRIDVKLRNGDYIEQFRGLQSFSASGEAFSFDETELAEIEAAERATGLFDPTPDKIAFFLERLTVR